MEQMRVIKEMRNADKQNGRSDNALRPRFLVWENVPGSLSSGKPKGADFQAVLTEIVKVADPDAPDVPMPEGGRWAKSGSLCGMGRNGIPFSVAYKIHDAQYWGVPQRRKRICVLADFNGLTAAEILFDPKLERTTERGEPYSAVGDSRDGDRPEVRPLPESVSGDSEQSEAKGQGSAGDTSEST